MMRNKLAAALIIAGVLTLGTAGVALAAGVKVVDNDFQPGSISVAAGETVTFTNSGGSPHTATADDGSFDTGTIQPGSSATVTFDKAGKYPFFCRFHGGPGGSGMSGVITVTGAAGGNTGGGSGGTAGGTAGGSAGGTTGGTAGGTGASTGGALPQTATPLPLIAAAGALLLGAGLWLGLRRRA